MAKHGVTVIQQYVTLGITRNVPQSNYELHFVYKLFVITHLTFYIILFLLGVFVRLNRISGSVTLQIVKAVKLVREP